MDILNDKVLMLSTIGFWAFVKHLGKGSLEDGAAVAAQVDIRKVAAEAVSVGSMHLRQYHAVPLEEGISYMQSTLTAIAMDPLNVALSFMLRAFWYDSGLPVLQIGHKLAASYMATRMPAALIDEVQPPWATFVIEVPTGMLHIDDYASKQRAEIRSVMVGRWRTGKDELHWSYIAHTDGMANLWLKQPLLSGMVSPLPTSEGLSQAAFMSEKLNDEESRVSELLGRLIINCMVHKTEGEGVKSVGKHHGVGSARNGTEPTRRVFQLCRAVTCDVRASIRDYLGGHGTSPTVQTLVSGYWRSQQYGPRNTLRRRQFIEPAWRGPETANIVQRAHKLG